MSESRIPGKSLPRELVESERTITAAQLGERLLRVLAPLRLKSLSLHDAAGELLWLNQGTFGPTQQRLLQQAMDAFSLDAHLTHLEREFEQGRQALFFCAQTALGERASLAFAIVSSRRRPDINFEALLARLFTTMRRFSVNLAPSQERLGLASKPVLPAPSATHTAAAAAPAALAAQVAAPQAPSPAPSPSLRSRPYARLRPGGTTRRYEIAAAGADSCERDLERAQRLLQLLKRRGARDAPAPASFALPLCAASVLGDEFLELLAPALVRESLADGMLGFCLPAAAWEIDVLAAERFIERCAALRCFAALDDFSLERYGFRLLRLRALRCLKLDATLTGSVLNDKFAHANVAAIVKAARVLGLYCVAKGVHSSATARWLAAAGVEFAEGSGRAASRGTAEPTTRRARALKLSAGA